MKSKKANINQLHFEFTYESNHITLKRKTSAKTLFLTGDKEDQFIKVLAYQFGVRADSEINLIKSFIKYDMWSFYLDKYTRLKIERDMGVPYSTLATSLRRLVKAGVMAKSGKTHILNAGFRGLKDIDCIMFKIAL